MTFPTVAYFCMEFALEDEFGIYSGGLGVLAGDVMYQADTQKLPIFGVGLAYDKTYIQNFSEDGKQVEKDVNIDFEKNKLTLVKDDQGQTVQVEIPIQNRSVTIQAWEKRVRNTKIILLDTRIPENESVDQHITDELYAGDREHRLMQEMVLGIGGMRMLQALNIQPNVYHMNEGHSAFLSLEFAYQMQQQDGSKQFDHILQEISHKLVYTNHTLVAAGRDIFSIDLVSLYFSKYAQQLGIPIEQIIELGRVEDSSQFSMNMLALRIAGKINAVSHFHAERAKQLWTNHPMTPITNGIHFPRWISQHKAPLVLQETQNFNRDKPLDAEAFWQAHQQDKKDLLAFVQKTTGKHIPQESLIFTWARRFVEYKRPMALFWQLDWLESIFKQANCPVHIIFGGKVHPHNNDGKELIARVLNISKSERFKDYITFIPNYSLEEAHYFVTGSDVWLNTPIEGYEACGTSGMKAALNGVLQCSTNDGWMREVDWKDTGWILDSNQISESLYNTIEKEIIPLYCQRVNGSLPQEWVVRMIASSEKVKKQFSAQRMLEEYNLHLYGGRS